MCLPDPYYFFYVYNYPFAGREETLTEHVLHWNKQKVLKLARGLSQKFVKVGLILNAVFVETL